MTAEPGSKSGRYVRPKDVDNRSTFTRRLGWRVEKVLFDLLYWWPMRALPVETASNAAAAIMKALGGLTSANRTMLRNLRMAFPDWNETKIRRTAAGVWETTGRIAGEMPHLDKIQPYVPDARVEVIGVEYLDHIRESGKPAVLIGGHLANWEAMAAAGCKKIDCQVTYRSINNPYIDKVVARARFAGGVHVLTPKGIGTRDLMRALSGSQSVFLMVDQKFNQGVAAPFFGYDAMTAPGAVRLAMKYGAPLMPVTCLRIGPARYRVTFHPPFPPEPGADEEAATMATLLKINRFIEDRIREAPDQWFWMHNRWPKEAWVKAGVM